MKTFVRIATLAVGLASIGTTAGAAPVPHVVDKAGDANFVNGQGALGGGDNSQDTRPASLANADIVAIYYETLFDTIKERDVAGNVTAVRYVQTAFRVSFETTGPVKPTTGPSVMFRIPSRIAGCTVFLDGYVRGSAPGANELERADINTRDAACPGGIGYITEGFSIAFEGNLTRLTYPLDRTRGLLAAGVPIEPDSTSKISIRTVLGQGTSPSPTTPAIDETVAPGRWVVGIDVPPDVVCADSPGHPDCQG